MSGLPRRRPASWRLLALGVVAAVGAAGPAVVTAQARDPAGDPAPRRLDRPPRAIAPGVTYQRVRERGPVVVHIVRIDPREASTVDVVPGGRRMGSFARPSSIGRARDALVAINGDFGTLLGMPVHMFQMDGSLMGRGIQVGANFAMSQDETSSFLGPPQPAIEGRLAAEGVTFPVGEWNSAAPERDEIAGFTAYGGKVRRPPVGGCAVRLVRDDALAWSPGRHGTTRRFEVQVRRCRDRRMRVDPATVVLASRTWGAGSDLLESMTPGDRVRLSWSLGWPSVTDSMGGVPRLVETGVAVASRCGSSLCRRHPRTGIGVTGDGTVMFVVVDGRSKRSVGVTLARFARTFVGLGAVDAVNLDGGGSSVMWIAGRGIVNRPSDPAGERRVVNAMLLLRGSDPGEERLGGGGEVRIAGSTDERPAVLAALDAGSTGGLAEAWVDGTFGVGPVPRAIMRVAERFARSR
jgi:Phosphodiester glycosidase